MQMKYYVGNQAEQFSFIRIPRELVVGKHMLPCLPSLR